MPRITIEVPLPTSAPATADGSNPTDVRLAIPTLRPNGAVRNSSAKELYVTFEGARRQHDSDHRDQPVLPSGRFDVNTWRRQKLAEYDALTLEQQSVYVEIAQSLYKDTIALQQASGPVSPAQRAG